MKIMNTNLVISDAFAVSYPVQGRPDEIKSCRRLIVTTEDGRELVNRCLPAEWFEGELTFVSHRPMMGVPPYFTVNHNGREFIRVAIPFVY